ncbi:hypothetical protein [Caldivirga maquilingensis]|uniref:Uncharacterized protein n=1 Tax=Caldivirga maquilingensis (strain ATCC 700844 / DSM 13496 / JCM 10307 / IC-167) TaxID=397948 RepID=A8MAF3_CALMQ|nr:hypothetical protein [Caldivirga maquilingensis]ABW02530.1 hypothetical protein Cmaq_1707 [Caldivirga maquilingensis IC-167]
MASHFMTPGWYAIVALVIALLVLFAFLVIHPNAEGSEYKLVVIINNSYVTIPAEGSVRYLPINSSGSTLMIIKCITLNLSSIGVFNETICLPYSVNSSYVGQFTSEPTMVQYAFDTLLAVEARLIPALPEMKGVIGNNTLSCIGFKINGKPGQSSNGFTEIVNPSYSTPCLIYQPLKNIAYGEVNLSLFTGPPGSHTVYLNMTIKRELIIGVLRTHPAVLLNNNDKLIININVNESRYIKYSYNISNPEITYLTEFHSVEFMCSSIHIPTLNTSYSNLCLPLGISVKMPGFFWFSDEPNKLLMPHVRNATALVLSILYSIREVRNYINGGELSLSALGFQVQWVKVNSSIPTYVSTGSIYYDWVFSVYAGGSRVGLIYVTMYGSKNGSASTYSVNSDPTYSVYSVNIDIRLVSRGEIKALNSVKLQGINAVSVGSSNWAGYVVSYDSGVSPYGNDTFEALTSWITVPQLSPVSCTYSVPGLAAWIGLSPGNQWYEPYIQAGWIWQSLGSGFTYQLFYADEPQGYLITPINTAPYAVVPYSTITVDTYYNYTSSNTQSWYINWYIGYPNGTYLEATYNMPLTITIQTQATNWQAAQFIVETPEYNGVYDCPPSITGGNLTFYTDYVYDTGKPTTQLAPNGTWIGLSQFTSGELMGESYVYRIALNSGIIEPSVIGQCTVPQGYYEAGYVSENCFSEIIEPPG